MCCFDPLLWRTARLIHDHLRLRRRSRADLYLPQASWAKAQQCVRQLELTRGRGWDRATGILRDRLYWQLERLHQEIERAADEVKRQQNLLALPSVAELAAELHALAGEFEELACKPRAGYIRVTTLPIVLESIELGPFQIQLDIKALSTSQCYRVIALEPNPAFANSSVTHPHVQNERLCEGEGHLAIQDALAEGRLLDFFLIVFRLLSNYGQGSAYVELKDWQGLPCRSCGSHGDDDGCYCQDCDERLCNDCTLWCNHCDSNFCDGCTFPCSQCQEKFCRRCLDACAQCQEPTCSRCLKEGLCRACETKKTSEADDAGAAEEMAVVPAEPLDTMA
jgi:hypothetical protein